MQLPVHALAPHLFWPSMHVSVTMPLLYISLYESDRSHLTPCHCMLPLLSLMVCWFQPELISQSIVFFSYNKPAPAGLISPETNQQTCQLWPCLVWLQLWVELLHSRTPGGASSNWSRSSRWSQL